MVASQHVRKSKIVNWSMTTRLSMCGKLSAGLAPSRTTTLKDVKVCMPRAHKA